MPRSADALQQCGDPVGRADLADEIDRSDVDTELERGGGDQRAEAAAFQAHLGVANMTPELFPKWLSLFSQTLDDVAPTPEAKVWFMATAERIAKSLTLSLFYNPALDDPTKKTV